MPEFKVKKNLQIAIDGPVASGKSTIAKILAQKLGILYVYTGAMYRAVAYLAKLYSVDHKDEFSILSLLKKTKITLAPTKRGDKPCKVFLEKKEITDKLFTQEISWGASLVAVLPKLRKELVRQQKEIANGQSVIMEGRDITTRVLPNADLKIYMTAGLTERARRRVKQLKEKGIEEDPQKIFEETKRRDYQDTHRQADPLKIVPDAYVLDTTNLTIKEVVNKIVKKLKEKKLIGRLL